MSHRSDAELIREALAYIAVLEAATFRSQAQAIIAAAAQIAEQAAAKLERSRFSVSARLEFRSRLSGMLRRAAHRIADLGWQAGGETAGGYPPDLVKTYLDAQQEHLSRWFMQIKQAGSLVGGAARGVMYAESLMGLYNDAWMEAQKQAGAPELPAVPRDGTTQCLTYCKCHWEFKPDGDGGYNAYWRVTAQESCPNCLCREQHWSPLHFVRAGGVWVSEESGGTISCSLYKEEWYASR